MNGHRNRHPVKEVYSNDNILLKISCEGKKKFFNLITSFYYHLASKIFSEDVGQSFYIKINSLGLSYIGIESGYY